MGQNRWVEREPRSELAFVHFFFFVMRESTYIWGERLLLSVGAPCVWDSHEGRVRFEADSAIAVRVSNMGVATQFPRDLSRFGAL